MALDDSPSPGKGVSVFIRGDASKPSAPDPAAPTISPAPTKPFPTSTNSSPTPSKSVPTESPSTTQSNSDSSSPRALDDAQLNEMLRPGKEFEAKLQTILESLPLGSANLLLVDVKDYSRIPHALITYFQSQKIPGVYVTVNKPFMDIAKQITPLPSNVMFIDVITPLTGKEVENTAQVTYLDSPLALVEMNMAISEKMKGVVANQRFLILDSVSTLLVYNSPQSVEKFCHTVIAKNRSDNTIGLFILIQTDEGHSVTETLSQFVDRVITVT